MPFAQSYQCMLTSMPNVALSDACFGAFMPEFGCLNDYCRRTLVKGHDEDLDYATPGCPANLIGDRMCDPICMSAQSGMDGGDCLLVTSAIKRKFRAVDWDANGVIDAAEYAELRDVVGYKPLRVFDIHTKDGGLDGYEFALLMTQMDHIVQDQLHGESGENIKWSRSTCSKSQLPKTITKMTKCISEKL